MSEILSTNLKFLGSPSTKKTTLNWLVLVLFILNIPLLFGYPRISILVSAFHNSALSDCGETTARYFCTSVFPLLVICLLSWASFRPIWMILTRRTAPARNGLVALLVRSRFACSSMAFYLGHITAILLLAANLSSNSLETLVPLSFSSLDLESIPLLAVLLTSAYYTWCSIVYCLVYSNMEQADKALDSIMRS